MLNLKSFFVYISVAYVLFVAPTVHAKNPEPGTYDCPNPADFGIANPGIVSGYCRYQAHPYGTTHLEMLAKIANESIKTWDQNSSNNASSFGNLKLPHQDPSGLNQIWWWFEDEASNGALGELLKSHDHQRKLQQGLKVKITATMYSFEKGRERELGLSVGSFYGKRELEDDPAKFESDLADGIFNAAAGIGNPLASFLQFGIKASLDSKHAETVEEISMDCNAGNYCSPEHTRDNYMTGPSSLEKTAPIGIKISATPLVDIDNPGLVALKDFNFTYSVPTGESTAPVDVFKPYSYDTLVMKTDEVYVIGSETKTVDLRTGHLLGKSSENAYTQSLIMIRVSVEQPDGSSLASFPQFKLLQSKPSFSDNELKGIPSGELSLEEIFESIELKCFPDILNPKTSEPICGFRFTKLDRRYMNHRLSFKINKPFYRSNPLRDEKSLVQTRTFAEVFKGKGYYQIPTFADQDSPKKYILSIELDTSNPVSKKLRKAEPIKGIWFAFGYYPKSPSPIEFDPGFIEWIK